MFCPNCGRESSNNAAFCQACGYRINYNTAQNQYENPAYNSYSTSFWYYLSNNVRKGPVNEQQISELIRNGIIDRDTMVWREGFSGWSKAEYTTLNYLFQSIVPATPINAISDKWLWTLATVPLIVNYLLSIILPPSVSLINTIIVLGLNILFITLDVNDLKKNGIKAESWLWLGILLVPVYLFVRASKTTKNIAPGIIWCVLFSLSLFIWFISAVLSSLVY